MTTLASIRSHSWRDIDWRTILTAVGLFIVLFGVMAGVQFSTPDMPDNDGFYHIRLAYILRTEGLKPDFRWLPLTILNSREYYDHHYLFHILLIPFTFGDLRIGAKWAAASFAALALLSVWVLLRGQRVPYAALWALGLLGVSHAFLYRMSITRAQSLSLAVLAIGLHWMLSGRYKWLLPLSFLYVWLYNAFPLLPIVALVYSGSVLLSERRIELRPVIYAVIGVLLGLIINPYFPVNLVFIYRHLLPKLAETTAVRVGNEWYPYTTRQLIENSLLSLAAFAAGVAAMGFNPRRWDARTASGFFLAVMTAIMLFQSRRFIEYYPAFALIFAAFAWAPLLSRIRLGQDEEPPLEDNSVHPTPGLDEADPERPAQMLSIFKRLNMYLDERLARLLGWPPLWRALAPAILAFLVIFGVLRTLPQAVGAMRDSKSYTTYAGASTWLMEHTEPGERIFQTDWDDFPRLFFYNPANTYTIGLDPTYMQLYNAALYDRWVEITQGEVDLPSQTIRNDFGARFVHSDLDHGSFIRQARNDSQMREVYRDDQAVIFEILP